MRMTSFTAWVPSLFKKRGSETTAGGIQQPENPVASNAAGTSSSVADTRGKGTQFRILGELMGKKKNKTPKPMSFAKGLATLQQRHAQQSSNNTSAPHLSRTSSPLKELFQQPADTQAELENTNARKISTQISEADSQRLQTLFQDSVKVILRSGSEEELSKLDRRQLERLFWDESVKAALQNREQEVFSGEDLQRLQYTFVESASAFLQDKRNWTRSSGDGHQPRSPEPVTEVVQGTASDTEAISRLYTESIKIKDVTNGDSSDEDEDFQPLEPVIAVAQDKTFNRELSFRPHLEITEEEVGGNDHRHTPSVNQPIATNEIVENEVLLPQSRKSDSISPSLSPNANGDNSNENLASLQDVGVIDPKSKEIRPERLKEMSKVVRGMLNRILDEDFKALNAAEIKDKFDIVDKSLMDKNLEDSFALNKNDNFEENLEAQEQYFLKQKEVELQEEQDQEALGIPGPLDKGMLNRKIRQYEQQNPDARQVMQNARYKSELDDYSLGESSSNEFSLNKLSPDKDLPGKAAIAELNNTLKRLDVLAEGHIASVSRLNALPDLGDKDIVQKLGAQLSDSFTKTLLNQSDERIANVLGQQLGEDIAQKLGEILDKGSARELGEKLARQTSAKASRTSWKNAWKFEKVFKNKTNEEVSKDPVQELGKQLGKQLGKDIDQKFGKQLGKGVAKDVGKQLGKDIAQKLCEQPDTDIATAQELGKQLVKDISQKFGEILDKDVSQKLYAQRLGEAVRDCFADAAKICEKHAKKADDGSEDQTNLAALSALFTELKRHHLAAAATPAFDAFSKAETKRMRRTTPGMAENRSGAAVFNTKEISLDVGFGTGKVVKGEAGVAGESAEELLVDDDGDQNAWNKTNFTSKGNAIFSFLGFLTFKLGGRLKTTIGGNYSETGSYADQSKLFLKHKNKDAYINKVWKSASPKAREWKNNYKSIQKYAKWATAANYRSVSAPTHLTEQKIAKGASNTSAIHKLAETVSSELAWYMKEVYPPLERPMSYAPISVPTGGAGLRGKEGTSITVVEGALETSLKAGIPKLSELTKGYLDFSAEGKLAGVGRRREFDIERLKPSHVLLSGAYTKDMRKSLDLWNEIETRSQKDSRLEAKLKLYERVKGAIDNARSTNAPHQDTSYDIAYFGPVTDMPETFLNTIHASESNLEAIVNAVAAQCQQLGQDYETFQQHAGQLYAVSQKGASKKVKAQYKALHRDAFEKINKSAWGREDGTSASGVKLADLVSSRSKRIEFLADSYDAISTALGGAGTYLEIVKAKVAEMEDPPVALVQAIEQADKSYSKTSAALVRAELPMHEDSLHRYNTIAWGAVSSKNEREVQASLSVGLSSELGEELLSLVSEDIIDLDADLNAAGLTISAGLAYKVFTAEHPNLTRGGDFREITLTLKGGAGPLTEAAATKAAVLALKRMKKDLGGAEITPEDLHILRDSIKTGLDAIGLDSTKGLVLSWKHHKFSKAGDRTWRKQFFRLLEQTKDTLSWSKTILTMIPGLTFKPGVRATQDLKNVLVEIMGPDISHHVLSLVRLDELRDKAKKKKMAQAVSAATTPVVVSETESRDRSRSPTPPIPSLQPSGEFLVGESSIPLSEPIGPASGYQQLTALARFSSVSPVESATGSTGTKTKSISNKDIRILKEVSDTSSSKMQRLYPQDGADVVNEGDYQMTVEALVTQMQKEQALANVVAAAEANGASIADELVLLKEEFDADPYRKNQFFSTNAILDVVKDYQDFLVWKKEGSPLDRQPESGFVFYDRAEIQDVARNARKVDSLAAGKSVFAVETNEGTEKVIKPQMRDSLSDPLTDIVSREELEAFEKRMEQELEERKKNDPKARITPDDRARLLLTTEEGKKIFNSYTNIVSTYKELTGVVTTLLGYEGRLREEMPKVQTAYRFGVAGERAGAALMSMFDGSGLHPSPKAGTEAANTLNKLGYFSPERMKIHDELAHNDESLRKADQWLARHGLAKADNGLEGMHSLIVALLQNATGRYDSLHVEEAAKYLKMCDRNTPLSANMEKVASAINRDHGKMQVHMIAPDSTNDGAPAWIDTLDASQEDDLDTPQKGARSVVIMRSKSAEGNDIFAAIVHQKRALASDIPEHLKQLEKAKKVRSVVIDNKLPNQDAANQDAANQDDDLTGIEQRAAMKFLGTQQRGRISSLMKNASASLADVKRPDRKTVRDLKYNDLETQIHDAVQSYGRSTRYWQEAVKEKKKRDNNQDMLNSEVVSRSPAEKTGKELRKETKETKGLSPNSGILSTAQQLASRFKHQSRTAEVMTRMTRVEVENMVQNAKQPEIKKAAEKELKKREEMEATLAQRRIQHARRQHRSAGNQVHDSNQIMKALEAEHPELAQNRRTTESEIPQ